MLKGVVACTVKLNEDPPSHPEYGCFDKKKVKYLIRQLRRANRLERFKGRQQSQVGRQQSQVKSKSTGGDFSKAYYYNYITELPEMIDEGTPSDPQTAVNPDGVIYNVANNNVVYNPPFDWVSGEYTGRSSAVSEYEVGDVNDFVGTSSVCCDNIIQWDGFDNRWLLHTIGDGVNGVFLGTPGETLLGVSGGRNFTIGNSNRYDYQKSGIYKNYIVISGNPVWMTIIDKASVDDPSSSVIYTETTIPPWDQSDMGFEIYPPVHIRPQCDSIPVDELYFVRQTDDEMNVDTDSLQICTVKVLTDNGAINVEYLFETHLSTEEVDMLPSTDNWYLVETARGAVDALREMPMNYPVVERVNGSDYMVTCWTTGDNTGEAIFGENNEEVNLSRQKGCHWFVMKRTEYTWDEADAADPANIIKLWEKVEEGQLFYDDGELSLWNHALTIDNLGTMFLTSSGCRPTEHPGVYMTAKRWGDPVFPQPKMVTAPDGASTSGRWGDYASADSVLGEPGRFVSCAVTSNSNQRTYATELYNKNEFFTDIAGLVEYIEGGSSPYWIPTIMNEMVKETVN